MSNKPSFPQSPIHFFTLRLWRERITEQQGEWRGSLRNGPSGTHQHFVGLEALLELINSLLEGQPHDPPESAE